METAEFKDFVKTNTNKKKTQINLQKSYPYRRKWFLWAALSRYHCTTCYRSLFMFIGLNSTRLHFTLLRVCSQAADSLQKFVQLTISSIHVACAWISASPHMNGTVAERWAANLLYLLHGHNLFYKLHTHMRGILRWKLNSPLDVISNSNR